MDPKSLFSLSDHLETLSKEGDPLEVLQQAVDFEFFRAWLVEGLADFCNPASGWEKGQVEKNVQDARRRLWQPMPSFPDLAALNSWLEERCIAQWSEIEHGVMPGTVADVHAIEVASLMPAGRPFDGFVEHTKRVSPTCLIAFERNRYSVPASFANRPVSLRVYPERLVIAAEGKVLCEHARIIDRSHHKPGRTIYDPSWTVPTERVGNMML